VPWNETHFSNAKFDEILTKAEGTLDIDRRRELMGELEVIMQEDGPIAQPLWRAGYVAYDKRAKNIKMHPTGFIFAEELAIEPS
jgi:peptide/nickel transport system substrate-binding protein